MSLGIQKDSNKAHFGKQLFQDEAVKNAGSKSDETSATDVAKQIIFADPSSHTLDSEGSMTDRTVSVMSTEEISKTLGEYEIPPDEIVPGVYLGNKDNAYNQRHLKALGITHILNAAAQAECPHENQFSYLKLSLLDTDEEDLLRHFENAITYIDEALKNGKVLVHCISGMSRSASLVVAWLIRKNDLSFDAALEMVQEKRSIVDPNEGFRQQLELFGKMQK